MTNKLRIFYIICALAVTVMFSLGNTTQGALLTEFSAYYGIGAFEQSFISAAASFGMAAGLCALLSGWIKITKNLLYVIAVGAVALSFSLIGMMPAYPLFLCLYALLGMAFGFIDAIGSSLIADVSAPEKLQRNMGMLHAFYGIGGILGPFMIRFAAGFSSGGAGTGGDGVRLTAYLLAGLAAVLLIINGLGFAQIKRKSPATLVVPARLNLSELAGFIRAGAVPLLLTTALYGAYLNVITFRMAQYISVDFKSDTLAALSLSVFWAGIVISRLTAPRIKLNLKFFIVGGMALTTVITTIGVITGSAVGMCVAAFFAGIVGGAVIPMCIGELCRLIPSNTLLASSSALLLLYVVQLAGALVAGAFTPGDNLGVGLYFAAAYALLGAVSAAFYRSGEQGNAART